MKTEFGRCVYFHLTPDTREVFYIGIGDKKRAYSKSGRNKYWKKKVDKHGFPIVLIILENLTSEKAAEYEKLWIKFYGLENLTNITPGGDGVKGFYHTIESRTKISNSLKGLKRTEREKQIVSELKRDKTLRVFHHELHGYKICTQLELRKQFNLDSSGISAVVTGKRNQHGGWRLIVSPLR